MTDQHRENAETDNHVQSVQAGHEKIEAHEHLHARSRKGHS